MTSQEISLTIKQANATKKTETIQISPECTIDDLRELISIKFNIPPNKQNLIIKGHILTNGKTIQESNINNNDTILLVEKKGVEEKTNNIPKVPLQSGHEIPGQINYDLLRQPMGGNVSFEQLNHILSIPEFSSQLNDMINDPNIISAMLDNPQIKPLLDANPFMRSIMSNPEFLRNMLKPENIKAMQDMMQNRDNLINSLNNNTSTNNKSNINEIEDSPLISNEIKSLGKYTIYYKVEGYSNERIFAGDSISVEETLKKKKNKNLLSIIFIILGSILFILIIFCLIFCLCRNDKEEEEKKKINEKKKFEHNHLKIKKTDKIRDRSSASSRSMLNKNDIKIIKYITNQN